MQGDLEIKADGQPAIFALRDLQFPESKTSGVGVRFAAAAALATDRRIRPSTVHWGVIALWAYQPGQIFRVGAAKLGAYGGLGERTCYRAVRELLATLHLRRVGDGLIWPLVEAHLGANGIRLASGEQMALPMVFSQTAAQYLSRKADTAQMGRAATAQVGRATAQVGRETAHMGRLQEQLPLTNQLQRTGALVDIDTWRPPKHETEGMTADHVSVVLRQLREWANAKMVVRSEGAMRKAWRRFKAATPAPQRGGTPATPEFRQLDAGDIACNHRVRRSNAKTTDGRLIVRFECVKCAYAYENTYAKESA